MKRCKEANSTTCKKTTTVRNQNWKQCTYASVLARRTLHQLEELGRDLSVNLAPDDLVRQSAGVTLAENQVAILGDCTCEPHMPNSFAQRTAIRAKKDHV